MMVTFISQCEKKALARTRKVLDAFAERIGSNTWQTLITQDGLLAIKRALRKTATKNTAVSCHWIRSRSRSELVWVVGNKSKFNAQGLVPVNRTGTTQLTTTVENNWAYLPLIKALVAVAALLHDWGKATALFQQKLSPKNTPSYKGDPIRHEWISVLLLHALVQSTSVESDELWLQALIAGDINEKLLKKQIKNPVDNPLKGLPMLAKLVAWLILTHHRLPLLSKDKSAQYKGQTAETLDSMLARIQQEWGYENRQDEQEYQKRLPQCFYFPKGLLSQSKPWLSQIKKWAQRLYDNQPQAKHVLIEGSYRIILHHARLCLMLGDHFVSSQPKAKHWQGLSVLYANTDRNSNTLKQALDEHLVGVAKQGVRNAHWLPSFEKTLPVADGLNALKKRSPKAYQWQDKAVSKIHAWRAVHETNSEQPNGFFAVNMASTGCGKTFANAKIMRALSDDAQSLRFTLALGLRTLTLQTGDEYRQRVKLDKRDLAVVIGSRAVAELHQYHKMATHSSHQPDNLFNEADNSYHDTTGSASQEPLLDEAIDFDGEMSDKDLSTVLSDTRDRQFLYAPVLACTIDHLMAATETKRGGRYILPTLRLMSSDLVIDEIDDFTGNDLIAIGRLIHLAGMLGRKVMISSATIPPFLAEGYFNSYREGWQIFCQSRALPGVIGCAWVDEFTTEVATSTASKASESITHYRAQHAQFIEARVAKLQCQPAKRKADIANCQTIADTGTHTDNHQALQHLFQDSIDTKQQAYFDVIAQSIITKHQHHHTCDKKTQLMVSFGVVRVANIAPCVALTRYLLEKTWPAAIEVRLMAYHSQQVLLMRSQQEHHLDSVLTRKESTGEPPQAFSNPVIRQHLNSIKQRDNAITNVIFILVATPVEEVGRDHDFDWAVIEPSSYRSIIQLAGRVRRHRDGEVSAPNIALLQYNWRGLRHSNRHDKSVKVFNRPGFEEHMPLHSHVLTDLIDVDAIAQRVDAIPRIQQPRGLTVDVIREAEIANSLIELEHMATWACLARYSVTGRCGTPGPEALQGWIKQTWFLTALSQQLTPFRHGEPSVKISLIFDDEKHHSRFCEKNEQGEWIDRERILAIERVALSERATSRLWLVRDFDQRCRQIADEQAISQRWASMRYGELSFIYRDNQAYQYNDQLGLVES